MTVREYLSEVRTDHTIWQQMPRRMLRHKTLQQCARLAFGIHGPQWREDEPSQCIARLMPEKIAKSQTFSTKENLRNRLTLKS